MPQFKTWMRWLIPCAILLAVAISLLYLFFTGVHAQSQRFDSLLWKNYQQSAQMIDPGCIRGGMALDLVNTGILIGLSSEELRVKLGSETSRHANFLAYALGQCHWDWKHSELAVHLNAAGKVHSAMIRITPF